MAPHFCAGACFREITKLALRDNVPGIWVYRLTLLMQLRHVLRDQTF